MTAQQPDDEITPGIIGSGLFRTRHRRIGEVSVDVNIILGCWASWSNTSRHIGRLLGYSSPLGRLMRAAQKQNNVRMEKEVAQRIYDTLEPAMEQVQEVINALPKQDQLVIHLHYISNKSLKQRCRDLGVKHKSGYYWRLAGAQNLFKALGGLRYL